MVEVVATKIGIIVATSTATWTASMADWVAPAASSFPSDNSLMRDLCLRNLSLSKFGFSRPE